MTDHAHHIRACERTLEAAGLTLDYRLRTRSLDSDSDLRVACMPKPEKLPLWCAETLLTGFRALAWGEVTMALRCAFQACEYAARCVELNVGIGGPNMHDALAALRAECETLVQAGQLSRVTT